VTQRPWSGPCCSSGLGEISKSCVESLLLEITLGIQKLKTGQKKGGEVDLDAAMAKSPACPQGGSGHGHSFHLYISESRWGFVILPWSRCWMQLPQQTLALWEEEDQVSEVSCQWPGTIITGVSGVWGHCAEGESAGVGSQHLPLEKGRFFYQLIRQMGFLAMFCFYFLQDLTRSPWGVTNEKT
jgi:hypothetical protein